MYRNVDELLSSKKLDAVIIATPNQLHEKHTVTFLKKKIQVPLCAMVLKLSQMGQTFAASCSRKNQKKRCCVINWEQ